MKLLQTIALASLFATSAIASIASAASVGGDIATNASVPVTNNTLVDAANRSTNVSQAADLSKAVGIATAPALTTTLTETCMGSTSVGGGFSGGSFSFGTTWRDIECVNRLNAREIHSYGDTQASKEIMCSNDVVREAFKRVGRPCAEDGGTYVAVSQQTTASVSQPTPVVVTPPVATDATVKDDADASAQDRARIMLKAEQASAAMHAQLAGR
jgi:hypothetical protein